MSYIIHVREQKTNRSSQFSSSLSSLLSLFSHESIESLMKEDVAVAICTSVSEFESFESFAFVDFKMSVIELETDLSLKRISSLELLDLIRFHITLLLEELNAKSSALSVRVC